MKDQSPDSNSSRNKRRLRVWISASLILVLAAAWIFRPHLRPNQSLVEPRLRALQKPYSKVFSTIFFDGGSIAILITDAGGQSERFFIPCDTDWKTAYVSKLTETNWQGTPVSNDAATLQELTAILSDHCDERTDYNNMVKLTGRLGDRWKLKIFKGWESLLEWWKEVRF